MGMSLVEVRFHYLQSSWYGNY